MFELTSTKSPRTWLDERSEKVNAMNVAALVGLVRIIFSLSLNFQGCNISIRASLFQTRITTS